MSTPRFPAEINQELYVSGARVCLSFIVLGRLPSGNGYQAVQHS